MAKTVTIRILNESSPNSPSPDAKSNKKKNKPEGSSSSSNELKMAKAFSKPVISMVFQTAEASFNRYLDMSEDYKAQIGVQNGKAIINIGKDVYNSTKSFAKMGMALGGPVGGMIGAYVGLITSVGRIPLQAGKTLAEQNRNLQEQAYSLYFTTARAGMVNYSRGTEN